MAQSNLFSVENHSSEVSSGHNSKRHETIKKLESLPSRSDIHLPRRLFHLACGSFIVGASFLFPSKSEMVAWLIGMTIVVAVLEYLRLTVPRLNQMTARLFGSIMRSGEENGRSGVVFYMAGCAVSAVVFPRAIAILAILYLAYGDPIASYFGVKYGKHFWTKNMSEGRKSIEGSLACFIFCAVLTFVVSFVPEKTSMMPMMSRIFFALLGGVGATLGEMFPLRTDDNLALPILSGAFLWLTAALFNLIPGIYLQ